MKRLFFFLALCASLVSAAPPTGAVCYIADTIPAAYVDTTGHFPWTYDLHKIGNATFWSNLTAVGDLVVTDSNDAVLARCVKSLSIAGNSGSVTSDEMLVSGKKYILRYYVCPGYGATNSTAVWTNSNCLIHYSMDEASGTLADDGTGGYTLTNNGCTLAGLGQIGKSVTISGNGSAGSSAYLSTATCITQMNGAAHWTVSFLIKPSGVGGAAEIWCGSHGQGEVATMTINYGSSRTTMYAYGDASDYLSETATLPTVGSWNHILISYDGTKSSSNYGKARMPLYMNGSPVTWTGGVGTIPATIPTQTGYPWDWGGYDYAPTANEDEARHYTDSKTAGWAVTENAMFMTAAANALGPLTYIWTDTTSAGTMQITTHKTFFADTANTTVLDTIVGVGFMNPRNGGTVTFGGTAVASYTKWNNDSIIFPIPAHNPHGYASIIVTNEIGVIDSISSGICYTSIFKVPGWGHNEGSYIGYPKMCSYGGNFYCDYQSRPSHIVAKQDSMMLYESLDSCRTWPNKLQVLKPTGTDTSFNGVNYFIATIGGIPKHVVIIVKWLYPDTCTACCYTRNVLRNSKGGYDQWTGPITIDTTCNSGTMMSVAEGVKQFSNGIICYVPYVQKTGYNYELRAEESTDLVNWTRHQIYKGSMLLTEATVEETKTNGTFQGGVLVLSRQDNVQGLQQLTSTNYGTTWSNPSSATPTLDVTSCSSCFGDVPPALKRALEGYIVLFYGRGISVSYDEGNIWTYLGSIKDFSNTIVLSNKLYGDHCEVSPNIWYFAYCTNTGSTNEPMWLWRSLPVNLSNTTVGWSSGSTRGWKIVTDGTKMPTAGKLTLSYDLSRITDASWWAAMPSTNAVQCFDVGDKMTLPVVGTQYINRVGHSGIIHWTCNSYGAAKTFVLETGPTMAPYSTGLALMAGDFYHVFTGDDTLGTLTDIASNLSSTSTSSITQNVVGKLGKAFNMTATSGNVTLPNLYGVSRVGASPGFYYNYFQPRVMVSFLVKENPANYTNASATFFQWPQSATYGFDILRQTGTTGDSMWIRTWANAATGQYTRIPYTTNSIDTSKYHLWTIFSDFERGNDTIYIDGALATGCKTSSRTASGFPPLTGPAYFGNGTSNSAPGLYDQIMFGTDFDTLQMAKIATAMYYNQVVPNSFWTSEEVQSPTLTVVNSTPAGTVTPGAGQHMYNFGDLVNIHYTPPFNYVFKRWVLVGTAQLNSDSTQVWINGNGVLTAVDSVNQVCWKNILHIVAGTGGTIATSAYDTVCVHNQSPSITAVPSIGYRFGTWTGAGITFTQCCQATTAATVDDSTNHTATANFTRVQYTLTTANAAHAGTLSPAAGAHLVDSAASQAISFVPPAGYRFTRWTSTGLVFFNADSTLVWLAGNGTLTAGDTLKQFTATISAAYGGTVTPSSAVKDSAVSFNITATTLKPWYTWNFWSQTGGGHIASTVSLATTTYMTSNSAITASWVPAVATAPTLAYPNNGDTGISKSLTLRWNKVASDSAYVLEMDTVATFNSGAHSLSYTTDTSAAKSFVETVKQKRYWRVYGKNTGGQSLLPSVTRSYTESLYPSTIDGWIIALSKTYDAKTNTQKASKAFIAAFVNWLKSHPQK